MNSLVESFDLESSKTYTLNGMEIDSSSQNALVDLFYAVGASRGQSDKVGMLFSKALNANVDLAVRIALYARDVRGGMGERESFRTILKNLANKSPELADQLIHKIPEVGRWDDVFALLGTAVEDAALDFYAEALYAGDALAAKWAPREKSAKFLIAKKLREVMGLSPRSYRRMLSRLSDTVEQDMSARNWTAINYSHVPSLAASRYQKAFMRNDESRYQKYIASLERGDAGVKINASAVYPYNVWLAVRTGESRVAEQQWKALPDYIPNDKSFLPMVDTSGSMLASVGGSVSAMDVSISLGVYMAERNKSVFKDRYMSFSAYPEWVDTSGLTLAQKQQQALSVNWGMNTNIEKAYELLLNTAVKNRVSQEDMPDYLIILSDMQFDYCVTGTNSVFGNMKEKFEAANYKLPALVFWNLVNYQKNTPVKFDQRGVALVSGFSPSLMESVLKMDLEDFTPFNIMLDTVMKDRYNWLTE